VTRRSIRSVQKGKIAEHARKKSVPRSSAICRWNENLIGIRRDSAREIDCRRVTGDQTKCSTKANCIFRSALVNTGFLPAAAAVFSESPLARFGACTFPLPLAILDAYSLYFPLRTTFPPITKVKMFTSWYALQRPAAYQKRMQLLKYEMHMRRPTKKPRVTFY